MSTKRKRRGKRARPVKHTLATLARAVARVDGRLEDIQSANEANRAQRVLSAQERVQLRAIAQLAADFAQADPLIDADRFTETGRVMRAALIAAGFIPADAPAPAATCEACGHPRAAHTLIGCNHAACICDAVFGELAPTDPSERAPVVLCSQVIGATAEQCAVAASYMFQWPGSPAKPICAKCSLQARAVAKSLGFDVPMVPL